MTTGIISNYLEKMDRPYSWLAKKAGVSVPHLVHVNSGKRTPSLKMMDKLYSASNGRIKPNHFIKTYNGRKGIGVSK